MSPKLAKQIQKALEAFRSLPQWRQDAIRQEFKIFNERMKRRYD